MKAPLKYAGKLSFAALAGFLKVNILGAISTVVVAVLQFGALSKGIDAGASGHVSAAPFLAMLFVARPVGSVLWYLTCIVSPFLFFMLANKYVAARIAHTLVVDKAESAVRPFLNTVLTAFQNRQPQALQNASAFAQNKLQLIHSVQTDPTQNKWFRRAIAYGLKKVHLEPADFEAGGPPLTERISTRTIQKLNELSKPSLKMVWIMVAVQWAFLAFIWATRF